MAGGSLADSRGAFLDRADVATLGITLSPASIGRQTRGRNARIERRSAAQERHESVAGVPSSTKSPRRGSPVRSFESNATAQLA